MKTLIGGAVAAVLGIIGLVIWFDDFVQVLTGVIPAMLLLGGGLAVYLGFDEFKETWKKEAVTVEAQVKTGEAEKFKEEIDELKKEIKTLKEGKT